MIDPTSDRAVYRQIADSLRQGIHDGTYPEGSTLPSENTLAETYSVTRMTARQAVEVLKAEGLVRSEHGRGVFVHQQATLTKQLAACLAETRRLRGLLARLEWSCHYECPACKGREAHGGHEPDCWLARELSPSGLG